MMYGNGRKVGKKWQQRHALDQRQYDLHSSSVTRIKQCSTKLPYGLHYSSSTPPTSPISTGEGSQFESGDIN